jgi:hypothetical protein
MFRFKEFLEGAQLFYVEELFPYPASLPPHLSLTSHLPLLKLLFSTPGPDHDVYPFIHRIVTKYALNPSISHGHTTLREELFLADATDQSLLQIRRVEFDSLDSISVPVREWQPDYDQVPALEDTNAHLSHLPFNPLDPRTLYIYPPPPPASGPTNKFTFNFPDDYAYGDTLFFPSSHHNDPLRRRRFLTYFSGDLSLNASGGRLAVSLPQLFSLPCPHNPSITSSLLPLQLQYPSTLLTSWTTANASPVSPLIYTDGSFNPDTGSFCSSYIFSHHDDSIPWLSSDITVHSLSSFNLYNGSAYDAELIPLVAAALLPSS